MSITYSIMIHVPSTKVFSCEPEARKRLAGGEPSEARLPVVICPKGERSEATSRSDREPPEMNHPTVPDTGCAPAGARRRIGGVLPFYQVAINA
jgi:hypothetical protein